MRRFVVIGHEAATSPDFSYDDLPGSGRLDLLCRCVADALLTSHGVRDDAEIAVILQDEVTVRFTGRTVRSLSPDERAVAGLLRSALAERNRAVGAEAVEVSPGVSVSKQGLGAAIEAAARLGPVVQLHGDGDPIEVVAPSADATFVLSDHREFTAEEQRLLDSHLDSRVSLGPVALQADQAITVVHNYLDRTSG